MRRSLRSALVGGAAVAALGLVPATVSATPSEGVSGEILARTTVAGHDYILRKVTIAPGGTTGWHFHDGMLYGVVAEGRLTHFRSDCTIDGVYDVAGTIVEPSGDGYVHMGRNLDAVPMVLYVLYVDPAGSPLSEDAPAPGCA
ncbi:cupin domain-containing protein [Rhodococcus sp. SGAir0479]|uniref:cupin domain-containing protein n=1 Tax=Rhodococcus sp. SGAir0479 TaxID=2567884 RepID=UPI0010CD6A1D|nr:cupin domain-containing protein [Rhodococcus sp. SGAir0479]QCQ93642.1 cupin domain-containing protein [Rhodococcus sp. SGAir0479]